MSVGAGAGVVSVGAGAGAVSVGAGAAGVLVLASVVLLSVFDDWLFVAGAGAFGSCGIEIDSGIAGAVGAGPAGTGRPKPSEEMKLWPLPDESHTVEPLGLSDSPIRRN